MLMLHYVYWSEKTGGLICVVTSLLCTRQKLESNGTLSLAVNNAGALIVQREVPMRLAVCETRSTISSQPCFQ